MAVRKLHSRAEAEARSIVANLKIEGQSLTSAQAAVIADVIDGTRDAETEVRNFKAAVAGRVQLRG